MGNFQTGFQQGIQKQFNLGEGQGFKDLFSGENIGKGLASALPGITTAIGGLAGNAISNGFSTTGGQVLSGIGSVAGMIPGIGMILGPALQILGGVANAGFGTKWDDEGIAKAEAGINSLNNFSSGASNYDSLMGDITRMNQFNKKIKASDLGEDGWWVNRTQKKANELNKDMSSAYTFANRNINNTADNISSSTLANLERNYAAFGGPLFAYGGQTHGSDFTNGLMFINNGGTHESNPYEGVPISMDQEGNPNLVEEGEVIWNDYVFSDRLKVPKAVRTKYKLRGPKDMTFADAIEKLSKESEERPNDPISLRGLNNILPKFMLEQETLKLKNKQTNSGNKFTLGGPTEKETKWLTNKGLTRDQWLKLVNSLTEDELKQLAEIDPEYTKEALYGDGTDGKATDGAPGDAYKAVYNIVSKRPKSTETDASTTTATTEEAPGATTPEITRTNRYLVRTLGEDGKYNIEEMGVTPWVGVNTDKNSEYYGMEFSKAFPNYKIINTHNGINTEEQSDDGTTNYYTDYMYDNIPQEEAIITPPKDTWMRYAPVAGYGLMALTDALGLTNKADYTNADAIINAANNISSNTIKFNPIGDFMSYNPFDTEYHANQLRSVAGANRRYIMNTSGGNRATAMAGILASDNNTMNQMGDLYRKAAEYNLEQKQKVADFNRATNMFNTEGMFKADAANQSNRVAGLDALIKGYTMREQANLMSDQAKAANISGLLEGIGDIGRENVAWNMIKYRTDKGVDGPGTETYFDDVTGYGDWRARSQARREARQAKKVGNSQ